MKNSINKRKGISSLISFALIMLASLMAIAIALSSSQATVGTAVATMDARDAENFLRMLDNGLKEVASEGNGSSRVMQVTLTGKFLIVPNENSVQFESRSSGLEYFSRTFRGGVVYITGNDVSCQKSGSTLVVENTYTKVVFQSVPKATPLAAVDTGRNIVSMAEKIHGTTVSFSNSSVVIDGNSSTSAGVGFSEILHPGSSMPECTVHFYVSSNATAYDVFYRLYAGADFISAEVRER